MTMIYPWKCSTRTVDICYYAECLEPHSTIAAQQVPHSNDDHCRRRHHHLRPRCRQCLVDLRQDQLPCPLPLHHPRTWLDALPVAPGHHHRPLPLGHCRWPGPNNSEMEKDEIFLYFQVTVLNLRDK